MVSSALVKVAAIDPLLESWHERGRTPRQALEQPEGIRTAPNFVLNLPASWEHDDPRIRAVAEALVECLAPDEVVLLGEDDSSEVLWQRWLDP